MHLQFEPKLTIRQGQVLAEFAAMVSRPGKTITETRDLITEMDRKLKLIRDLTHEGVSDVHTRSVLIGLLDPMTRQHAAYKQGEAFGSFRNAVLEFTNAASLAGTVSKSDPMQAGGVNMPGDGTESTEFLPAESSSGVDTENIWAVSGG